MLFSKYFKMVSFLPKTFFLFLVISCSINISLGCFFRTSSWHIFSTSKDPASSHTDLQLDKETISVVQQTLVKTLISLGKLKFKCPRENGTYPDVMDCRKYYHCANSNFTTKDCPEGQGFEPQAQACVRGEAVPLCQKVEKLNEFKCNGTGLHAFSGSCEKFILCTEEAAFASTCNHGDIFDQNLLLCLPEKEGHCNATVEGANTKENSTEAKKAT